MSQQDGHTQVGDEISPEIVRQVREDLKQAKAWTGMAGSDVYERLAMCETYIDAAMDRLRAAAEK
jgi:hypothetical protein